MGENNIDLINFELETPDAITNAFSTVGQLIDDLYVVSMEGYAYLLVIVFFVIGYLIYAYVPIKTYKFFQENKGFFNKIIQLK